MTINLTMTLATSIPRFEYHTCANINKLVRDIFGDLRGLALRLPGPKKTSPSTASSFMCFFYGAIHHVDVLVKLLASMTHRQGDLVVKVQVLSVMHRSGFP